MKTCLHSVREESAISEILVTFGVRFFSVQFNTGLALNIYLLFRTWRTLQSPQRQRCPGRPSSQMTFPQSKSRGLISVTTAQGMGAEGVGISDRGNMALLIITHIKALRGAETQRSPGHALNGRRARDLLKLSSQPITFLGIWKHFPQGHLLCLHSTLHSHLS